MFYEIAAYNRNKQLLECHNLHFSAQPQPEKCISLFCMLDPKMAIFRIFFAKIFVLTHFLKVFEHIFINFGNRDF